MGILSWAKNLEDQLLRGVGTVADAIVPGNQSNWHYSPQQVQQARQAQATQAQTTARRAVGVAGQLNVGRPGIAQAQVEAALRGGSPAPLNFVPKPITIAPPPSLQKPIAGFSGLTKDLAGAAKTALTPAYNATQYIPNHIPTGIPSTIKGAPSLSLGEVSRQIPSALGQFFIQPALQAGVRTGLGITGKKEFVPKTALEQTLFGSKPVQNVTGYGREVLNTVPGLGDVTPKPLQTGFGVLLAGLDATPFGGAKKTLVERLALAGKSAEVAKILGTAGSKLPPDTIKILAAEKNPQTIAAILKSAEKTVPVAPNEAQQALNEMAKEYADHLRTLHKETGGTTLIKDQTTGAYSRQSSNDPFYRSFYKQNGKAPTIADWTDEAHRQLSKGKDDFAQAYQATKELATQEHLPAPEATTSIVRTTINPTTDDIDTAVNKTVNNLTAEYPNGITLYHQTNKSLASVIKKTGFKGNNAGDVYFSAEGINKGRNTSSDNTGLIKVVIKPEDYHMLTPDRGAFPNEIDGLAAIANNGIKGHDVTIPEDVANKYIKSTKPFEVSLPHPVIHVDRPNVDRPARISELRQKVAGLDEILADPSLSTKVQANARERRNALVAEWTHHSNQLVSAGPNSEDIARAFAADATPPKTTGRQIAPGRDKAQVMKRPEVLATGKTLPGADVAEPGFALRHEQALNPKDVASQVPKGTGLNPTKNFATPVKTRFTQWVNGRGQNAQVKGLIKAEEFKSLDKAGMDAIDEFQAGSTTGAYGKLRQYFDERFAELTKAGVNLGGKDNYLTQIWNNSPKEIEAALGRIGSPVTLQGSISMPSVFKTYKDGIEAGLSPKFTKMSDIVQWYEGYTSKILADRRFVNDLIGSGHILSAEDAPRGWVALSPDQFPVTKSMQLDGTKYTGVYKAPPELAKVINNTIMPSEGNKFDSLIQTSKQLVLGAGIPGTGINFHGFPNISTRVLMARGPVATIDAVYKMANVRAAERWSRAHLKDIDELSASGMNTSVEGLLGLGESKQGGNTFMRWHSKLFEEPGFAKAYPAIQTGYAMSIRDGLLKKGLPRDQALKIAANASNSMFSGTNYKELGRSPGFQRNLSRVFLAPSWAGTNITLGKRLVASLGRRGPEYMPYRRLAVGVVTSYVTANLVNKELSGHYMYENPAGQQFSIDTGTTSGDTTDEQGNVVPGKRRYFQAFGTGADFARLPADAVTSIAAGDTEVLARMLRNRLSTVLGAAVTVITGTDYTGGSIYEDKNGNPLSGTQKALAAGAQVAGLLSPTQVSAGIGYATGKLSGEQAIAQGFEAPIRYKKDLNPETKTYLDLASQYRQGIDNSDQQALWDNFRKGARDNKGNKIASEYNQSTGTARYAALFEHPGLLATETAFQRDLADKTGQALDPLFASDMTPAQQLAALNIRLEGKIAPGELGKTKSILYGQLPSDYKSRLDQFYTAQADSQAAAGKAPRVDANPYPQASAQTQGLIDQYNALGTNTKAKANFKAAHPEIDAYYASLDSYNNTKRAAIGLPSLDEVSPYPKKGTGSGRTASTGRKRTRGATVKVARTPKIASPRVASAKTIKLSKAPKLAKVSTGKTLKLKKTRVAKVKSLQKARVA